MKIFYVFALLTLSFLFPKLAVAGSKYCNGQSKTFAGDIVYPNGKSTKFAGNWAYPSGKNIHFALDLQYPEGTSMVFAGDFQYMNGRSATFAGNLVHPNGKTLKSGSNCYNKYGEKLKSCPSQITYVESKDGYLVKVFFDLQKEFPTYMKFGKFIDQDKYIFMTFDLDIETETILNIHAHCFEPSEEDTSLDPRALILLEGNQK